MEFVAGTLTNRVSSTLQGSTCAVYIGDEGGPSLGVRTWRLEIYADNVFVGELTTRTPPAPPAAAVPGQTPLKRGRMVAMACSPGAKVWAVQVAYVGDIPTPRPKCQVEVVAGETPLEPGLKHVNERPGYVSGDTAGTVQIARGQRVSSWSAFATAAGATVQINGGTLIPLPSSGVVSGEPLGLDGAVFDFAGAIGGYFIEFREC